MFEKGFDINNDKITNNILSSYKNKNYNVYLPIL